MGILDDAIREHLDLKRKHGARDADLREIEDEAFGSTDRPDPFAANELFTEVSSSGDDAAPAVEGPSGEAAALDEIEVPGDLSDIEAPAGGEEPTRLVEPEALRPSGPSFDEPPSEPLSPPEGSQIPGQVELPGQDEIPGQETLGDPLEGYQPSSEPPAPEPPASEPPAPEPDVFEPEDAADAPAPSESLEDLIAEEEPFPADAEAPSADASFEPSAPPPAAEPDDQPLDEPEDEAAEPQSAVPDPPPPPPDTGREPPGRARGRVDVPTQEHPPPGETGGLPPLPPEEPLDPVDEAPSAEEPLPAPEPYAEEPASDDGAPALYDFETDEDPLEPAAAPADDDFEALGPAEEEAPYLDEEEPYAEEPAPKTEIRPEEPGTEVRPALEDEEVYEGGGLDPEESYEEDEGEEGLWFEKGPPKDFDFD
jgi:hypothetical protein